MRYYFGEYPPKMQMVFWKLMIKVLDCEGDIPHELWCQDCLQIEARIEELCYRWRQWAIGENFWVTMGTIKNAMSAMREQWLAKERAQNFSMTPPPKFRYPKDNRYLGGPDDGEIPPYNPGDEFDEEA